jgi:hypothetical protein
MRQNSIVDRAGDCGGVEVVVRKDGGDEKIVRGSFMVMVCMR